MSTRTRRSRPRRTGADRLPGDPSPAQLIAAMVRVDQAGEYGAARMYDGQLAVLGRARCAPVLRRMAEREKEHLKAFDRLIVERRVRPTLLAPLWHLTGFALGVGTALLGERAAMACTVAVETVIDEHYARQVARLGDDEADLRSLIEAFRKDEVGHRETALAHGAEGAPGYPLLDAAIQAGTRLAIWLSTRL